MEGLAQTTTFAGRSNCPCYPASWLECLAARKEQLPCSIRLRSELLENDLVLPFFLFFLSFLVSWFTGRKKTKLRTSFPIQFECFIRLICTEQRSMLAYNAITPYECRALLHRSSYPICSAPGQNCLKTTSSSCCCFCLFVFCLFVFCFIFIRFYLSFFLFYCPGCLGVKTTSYTLLFIKKFFFFFFWGGGLTSLTDIRFICTKQCSILQLYNTVWLYITQRQLPYLFSSCQDCSKTTSSSVLSFPSFFSGSDCLGALFALCAQNNAVYYNAVTHMLSRELAFRRRKWRKLKERLGLQLRA